MNTSIKYFIYARKSTESDERQVQSIPDQLKVLTDLAKDFKLKVVGEPFTETKSAKEPRGRAVFEDMLRRIEAGEANGILTWKIDRLSRNPIDSARIQWLLQQSVIESIQTIGREYCPDDNALILSVESSMANQYIRDLSKNVKRGLNSKVEKGWRPGSVPHGYSNTKFPERGTNYIVKDERDFPIIRKVWDYMLTGSYGPTEMLDILNNQWGFRTRQTKKRGGDPLSNSGLYRMLSNSFYAGYLVYKDAYKRGEHEPMVTDTEFDRMQVLLGRYGKPRPQRYEYAYPGAIKCGECGGFVSATFKEKKIKKTGEAKAYTLYYCTAARRYPDKCSQRHYTNLEAMEERIEAKLAAVTILPEFRDFAIDLLDEMAVEDKVSQKSVVETRSAAVADAEKRLAQLLDMRLKGMIEDEEYMAEKSRLKKEIGKLEIAAKQAETEAGSWIELTKEAFDFALNAHSKFLSGDAKTRREILEGLGGLNCTLKDQQLSIQAVEWLVPIQNDYPAIEAEYRLLEPELSRTSGTENAFEHFRPVVRGQWDLNRLRNATRSPRRPA